MHTYAIFSARYLPQVGGVENFTYNLAHKLASQGDKVVIVSCRLDSSDEMQTQEDGVEVVRLEARSWLDGRLPITKKSPRNKKLLDKVADLHPDRIIINTRFYKHSLVGLEFAQSVGVRPLVIEHGSAHLTLANSLADKAIEKYEHSITEKVRSFDPIFAGISHKACLWLEHFDIQTDLVVPNAIDVDEFRELASERDFISEFKLKKDRPIVCFAGRLCQEKGCETLGYVARMLRNYEFLVAGAGPEEKTLSEMKLRNLHLTGPLNRADISRMYEISHIFCLPSRSEGFCTALLEAAAWGNICVMPDVGGVEEVIGKDDSYGIIVKSDEPISYVAAVQAAQMQIEDKMDPSVITNHIKKDCSWANTLSALDKAFS